MQNHEFGFVNSKEKSRDFMPRPKTTKVESLAKKPKKTKGVVEEFFDDDDNLPDEDADSDPSTKKIHSFKNLTLVKCSEQEIKEYVGISLEALYRVRGLDVRILLFNGRKALIAPTGELHKSDRLNVSVNNRTVVELLGKG